MFTNDFYRDNKNKRNRISYEKSLKKYRTPYDYV